MAVRILFLAGVFYAVTVLWAGVGGQPPSTGEPAGGPSAPSSDQEYGGSDSCRICHASIYEAWQSTRHSFSVLTGEEARRAGYPLPPRSEGTTDAQGIKSWNDVLFVVGGRKRIAYVDATGQVLPTSFHPRRGGWSPFPAKAMECGPCHYTGFNPTQPNPHVPRAVGSWAELNIGCEACHGPGARHAKTYDKADIRIDPSSRLCGTCHTRVGRVLPRDDDFHSTHDEVQTWNQDPHVTGMKFRSHDMFCARCHSPYERVLESDDSRKVFSEAKGNVTCVGCHNPHALTSVVYRRDRAHLGPPQPPRSHIFKGQDADVTTDNFVELEGGNVVCVQCHTGADRIDLDHANAGCTDCHNAFRHNRSADTRLVADPARPRLSCRQCHADGDHLLTIAFRDPAALRPSYLHNLATLPASFRAKHGFRYVARATSPTAVDVPAAGPSLPVAEATGAAAVARTPPLVFLQRGEHRRLSEDVEIRKYQLAVRAEPGQRSSYFDLASAYAARGENEAAADVVERALECPPDRALAGLVPLILRHQSLLAGLRSLPSLPSSQDLALQTLAATIGRAELGSWLQGCLSLERLQFAQAKAAFEAAARVRPTNPDLRFFQGLSSLGLGEIDAGLAVLEAAVRQHPAHVPSRVALGIGYLEKRQFANADKELRRAISDDPRSAAAPYALAVGLLRQGLPASAIDPLLLCVRRDPDYLEAYFELARAYRRAGAPEESIDVYRRLLARRPDHVEAHWELANLLKYLFDVTTFRIESLRGSPQPPPEGVPPQALLGALVERADQYQELALSELTISLRLRPGDPRAIHHVADLHRRSGRLREAAGLFEWLARTQSDEWLYHHRLGTTLIELGEDNRALAALAQASRLAPSQGDVYAAIGFAHLKQQRLEQAIEMLDKAKVFLPFSPALYTNLGVAYALQGSFDVARRHLRRAVALGTFPLPRLHLTFTNLGLVELRDGHPEEAITAFETALHLAPGYVPAANLLTKTRSNPTGAATWSRPEAFVVNDMLEIFGEISTVALDD